MDREAACLHEDILCTGGRNVPFIAGHLASVAPVTEKPEATIPPRPPAGGVGGVTRNAPHTFSRLLSENHSKSSSSLEVQEWPAWGICHLDLVTFM